MAGKIKEISAQDFKNEVLEARGAGVEFVTAVDVSEVDLEKKEILVDGFERIRANKIILATGASPKPLGIKGAGIFVFAGMKPNLDFAGHKLKRD